MRLSATFEERLRLYGGLGRSYELLRRWTEARETYEALLATAREAGGREAEWDALSRLAGLATDMSTQPEADNDLFQGVKRRSEADAAADTGGFAKAEAGSETPAEFSWSPSYALERAEEALELARGLEREDLVAHSLGLIGLLGVYTGRWEAVADRSEEARSLYAGMGDKALEAEFLNLSAWGTALIGEPVQAVRFGRQRRTATRELGDGEIHLADLHGLTLGLLEAGEYEEALSVADLGLGAARSLGSSERLFPNLLLMGDVCLALYRLEEAYATYQEMSASINFSQIQALTYSKLCAVAALGGNWEEARAHALWATELRGEVVLQWTEPFHRHLEVEALLRGGEREIAREELERFGEWVGENRRLRVAYLRARAVLDRWENRAPAVVEHLREAEKLVGEMGLPAELWQIRADLGELYEERGEYEEAQHTFSRAAEIVKKLAGKITDVTLREGFLAAPQVRRVLERIEGRREA